LNGGSLQVARKIQWKEDHSLEMERGMIEQAGTHAEYWKIDVTKGVDWLARV
jgi:hypothetical protein